MDPPYAERSPNPLAGGTHVDKNASAQLGASPCHSSVQWSRTSSPRNAMYHTLVVLALIPFALVGALIVIWLGLAILGRLLVVVAYPFVFCGYLLRGIAKAAVRFLDGCYELWCYAKTIVALGWTKLCWERKPDAKKTVARATNPLPAASHPGLSTPSPQNSRWTTAEEFQERFDALGKENGVGDLLEQPHAAEILGAAMVLPGRPYCEQLQSQQNQPGPKKPATSWIQQILDAAANGDPRSQVLVGAMYAHDVGKEYAPLEWMLAKIAAATIDPAAYRAHWGTQASEFVATVSAEWPGTDILVDAVPRDNAPPPSDATLRLFRAVATKTGAQEHGGAVVASREFLAHVGGARVRAATILSLERAGDAECNLSLDDIATSQIENALVPLVPAHLLTGDPSAPSGRKRPVDSRSGTSDSMRPQTHVIGLDPCLLELRRVEELVTIPRNDAEAAVWFRRAAEQGDTSAQVRLAGC